MTDTATVNFQGEEMEVTLDDLLGLDTTGMEADYTSGFKVTPKNVSLWRVTDAMLDSSERDGEKFIFGKVELECLKCYSVTSDEFNEETFVGQKHTHTEFFNRDAKKAVGHLLAMMESSGLKEKGPLGELLDKFVGMEFVCKMTHSRNKNNPDQPYVNIDFKGIQTQAEFEAA